MLKDHSQLKLPLSPYQGIYDAIIPANHLLRKMKENIDFSFINPMLRKQYCENFGRPAKANFFILCSSIAIMACSTSTSTTAFWKEAAISAETVL